MTEPLRLAFDVACPAEHAFTVWTSRIAAWWPLDHTVDPEPDLRIVLEPGVGGRIFERTPAGVEVEWGEVTVWEPPRRLGYLWHIGADRTDATDVEITFIEGPDGTTRVQIEHRGWERLGDAADARRDANLAGWQSLLPHFVTACGQTIAN